MKYSREERDRIGQEIYEHKLTCFTAAAKYGISNYTARDYLRGYKAKMYLEDTDAPDAVSRRALKDMTREELMEEIFRLRAECVK